MTNKQKDVVAERLAETFKGQTQDQVGKLIHAGQTTVSKWLSGEKVPTTETLLYISQVYHVSVDWLLGLSDEREIDSVAYTKLTYEQVVRLIDYLIAHRNLLIPDLSSLKQSRSREPIYDPGYIKVNDRLLAYLLRRRKTLQDMGDDMLCLWRDEERPGTLFDFKGLQLMDNDSLTEAALDIKGWAQLNSNGKWIEIVRQIQGMSKERLMEFVKCFNKEEGEDKEK